MPLYHYICNQCEEEFELRHRYGEKDIVCLFCGSDSIQKHLGNKINISTKTPNILNKNKVGYEVNKAIEEGKQDLEKIKKDLSKERKKDE